MFLSHPQFENLTVEIDPHAKLPYGEVAREALYRALEESGVDGPSGWVIEPVHPELRPTAFDLLPEGDGALTVGQGWDLSYALREQVGVLDAEPEFATTTDALDDDEAEDPGLPLAAFAEEAVAGEDDFGWSPELVEAPAAWELPPRPPGGRSRGEGIVVAHPDSGYRRHRELFDVDAGDDRVLRDRAYDYVDRDDVAEHRDGSHGLKTASVLMSLDNLPEGEWVTGVAPAASLVPMRVAKKRFLVPVPVLFGSGMRRLREAIYGAIDRECHVISISLGWIKGRAQHRAVREAVRRNLILCAAAGNYVPFVVWPAHYPEVIAVAGCTADRRVWRGSSRGSAVDVTAPAKNVWTAYVDDDGNHRVRQSSGTSFSAATTAGIAALWLAHFGRDALIDEYGGEFTLSEVFREHLKRTVDAPPVGGADGSFGEGIVNARKLLETDPPTLQEMRSGLTGSFATAFAEPVPAAPRGLGSVLESFGGRAPEAVRGELGRMLEVPPEDLDDRLRGYGDEVAFHVLTNPDLRERLAPDGPELGRFRGDVRGAALEAGLAAPEEETMVALPLSGRLRRRLRE